MQFKRLAARLKFLHLVVLVLSAAPYLAAQSDNPDNMKECSSTAVYRYSSISVKGGPICKITVDRDSPGSPFPVQVPPKTKVLVVVTNQRPHEIIQASIANDAVAVPDIAGGILAKLAGGPLGGLEVSPAPQGGTKTFILLPGAQQRAADLAKLGSAQKDAYAVLVKFNGAYVAPTCLEAYVVFDAKGMCTQKPLVSDPSLPEKQKLEVFEKAIDDAISGLKLALMASNLPKDESTLDSLFKMTCQDASGSVLPDCVPFKRNQDRIDTLLSTLTAKTADNTTMTTVKNLINTLSVFAPLPATVLPVYTEAANRKLTIKLSTQEQQIGNTTTTLATVVITWQQTNWSLSTGVVLSGLKNRTFANSPIYNANGTPDTDSTGKVLTQVTVAKTYPGIIAPVFLVNYRLHNFQADRGRLAILLSGGLGLNPFTKSADFAVGPSLQWGNVVFSTTLHYGRQTELTGGVHVGDQLGTSPPAVPTVNAYKPAWGFIGVTYRIPLP